MIQIIQNTETDRGWRLLHASSAAAWNYSAGENAEPVTARSALTTTSHFAKNADIF
jgi:hypothetical protein